MIIRRAGVPRIALAAALVGTVSTSLAQDDDDDYVGKWLLTLDHRPAGFSLGQLEIERSNDGLLGFIDGGPVPLTVAGDEITLLFDWDDGGGTVYVSELQGTLVDGRLEGDVRRDGAQTGAWRATRRASPPGIGEPPQPADLAGTWAMRTDDGTGKDTFAMTPAAIEFQQAFDPRYDDPVLRCVSDGLVRVTGGPFAKEIIQQPDRVTVLYEDMHEIRRIHLDREFPEDVDVLGESLGYSIGHWEGSTLVVETRGLKEALWHRAGGEPISAEARVTEHIYVGEDGNLHVELTLHDPANYVRPPQRHTVFAPVPDYEFSYYSCDPDAFYRGLYLENRLDHYFDRSRYRR